MGFLNRIFKERKKYDTSKMYFACIERMLELYRDVDTGIGQCQGCLYHSDVVIKNSDGNYVSVLHGTFYPPNNYLDMITVNPYNTDDYTFEKVTGIKGKVDLETIRKELKKYNAHANKRYHFDEMELPLEFKQLRQKEIDASQIYIREFEKTTHFQKVENGSIKDLRQYSCGLDPVMKTDGGDYISIYDGRIHSSADANINQENTFEKLTGISGKVDFKRIIEEIRTCEEKINQELDINSNKENSI